MVYFWTLAGSFPRATLADFRIVLDNKSWTEIHCWNASWSSILHIIIINMTVHSAGSCIVTKWYNSHGFWGLLKDIFWRYCISVQFVPLLYKLFCRKILHCSTEEFEVFLINLCMQRFMAIFLRKKRLQGSRWQGWHIKQKIYSISGLPQTWVQLMCADTASLLQEQVAACPGSQVDTFPHCNRHPQGSCCKGRLQ